MASAESTEPDAGAIAEEAFVLAYPLLRISRQVSQARPQGARGINTLIARRSEPDTLRLSAWLDLREEPVVLFTPNTCGRYYVLWFGDAWGRLFASAGARATGTGSRVLALVGPGHNGVRLPAGVTRVSVPTCLARVAGCIEALAGNAGDGLIASGFRMAPLSRWLDGDDGGLRTIPAQADPSDRVEALDARTFFSEVFRLIDDNPPRPDDRVWLDRLGAVARLQVPGAWEALAPDVRTAIEAGVRRGGDAIQAAAVRPTGTPIGSWRISYGAGCFGAARMRRAAAAQTGPGAFPAIDELTAVTSIDERRRTLTGRHRYTLRFAPDAPPPANGFWSLTTWGDRDRVASYATGDLRGLTLERDGSLPIHVQHRPPGRERRGNWLPTPPGRFSVALRLYWPGEDALNHRWTPPSLSFVEEDRLPG